MLRKGARAEWACDACWGQGLGCDFSHWFRGRDGPGASRQVFLGRQPWGWGRTGRGVLGRNGPLSTGTAPAGAPARSLGLFTFSSGGGSWRMGRGDGTTGWEQVATRVLEGCVLRLGQGAGQRSSSVGWASGQTKLGGAVSPSPTARRQLKVRSGEGPQGCLGT